MAVFHLDADRRGPARVRGVTNLLDGNTVVGVGFLVLAVVVYALFEFVWIRAERKLKGLVG